MIEHLSVALLHLLEGMGGIERGNWYVAAVDLGNSVLIIGVGTKQEGKFTIDNPSSYGSTSHTVL
jgi:hypothetical protein